MLHGRALSANHFTHALHEPGRIFTTNERGVSMNSWKTEYDDQVVAIVNSNRRVTIDELCDRLDLMRDQIDEIVSRLVACGTIDNKLDA
jgi:hypothetical protein